MGQHSAPDSPTQVRHPWRAAGRTAFQATVGIAAAMPVIVAETGLPETWTGVAIALGVSAGLTRVMAIPSVDLLIDQWLPWLSTSGSQEADR